jgi:hypothetical protein
VTAALLAGMADAGAATRSPVPQGGPVIAGDGVAWVAPSGGHPWVWAYVKDDGVTKAKAIGVLFAYQRRSGRCYYSSVDNIRLDTTFTPSFR